MNDSLCLEGILFDAPREGRGPLEVTGGAVPEGLEGTYFLNGPSNLERGDFRYKHWLDGDGFVRAVHFRGGGAEIVSKFVRTKKFEAETEADRPIYRAFGTSFPGDQLRRRMALETPANVSIYSFGGRLFAFGEQALPWELDRETLETVGEFDFGGELLEISPFSAHPKVDHERNLLSNFGLKYGLGKTTLCYWEFDGDFRKVHSSEFTCPRPVSVHDFALSPDYAVFYLSPYDLDIGAFVRKGESIHDSLSWHPEQENLLVLIPRDGDSEVVVIGLGVRGFCLHLIGACKQGDRLVVDLIETSEPLYPQYEPLPNLFRSVRSGAFVRIVVQPDAGAVESVSSVPYPDVHLDFPVARELGRGGVCNDVWVLAVPVEPEGETKYFDRLLRFSWEERGVVDSYSPPTGSYLAGEMALVEGEGVYLIVPVWHSRQRESSILIFRAYELSAGPIATLSLPYESPLGFHASFQKPPQQK